MKIGILSESEPQCDDVLIRAIVERVLGQSVEVAQRPIISRGWPNVLGILSETIKHFHLNSDADGLVGVVDSDFSHLPAERRWHAGFECRLFQLQQEAARTMAELSPRGDGTSLQFAAGLAVPCIKAWMNAHETSDISEPEFVTFLDKEPRPSRWDIKQQSLRLKTAAYGSSRASAAQMRARFGEAGADIGHDDAHRAISLRLRVARGGDSVLASLIPR